jgi:RHS repeat-associated protein
MIQDEAGRQLQYNAWNRLVRVSLSGDQVAAYQYNGFQQRIVTIVGDGPSAIARDLFYSAGWQVLEQRIRTGSSLGSVAEEQFVWSMTYLDGLILRDQNADLNAATGAGGLEERVYALQDALWNTTALVDVNGNVLNRFAYTPYGVVETLNANWTSTASPSIPWAVLFRGYFADEGTGLLHARARQYSPTLGRFVSRDPLEYVDGMSMYSAYFVPNGLDPSGKCTCTKEEHAQKIKDCKAAMKLAAVAALATVAACASAPSIIGVAGCVAAAIALDLAMEDVADKCSKLKGCTKK